MSKNKMSRRSRVLKAASSDCAIFIVLLILFVGIIFCYPQIQGGDKTLVGTMPIYIGQKILELIMGPILIGQLLNYSCKRYDFTI
ncbi:hypothetical protein [Streptococcus fryi]